MLKESNPDLLRRGYPSSSTVFANSLIAPPMVSNHSGASQVTAMKRVKPELVFAYLPFPLTERSFGGGADKSRN